MRVRQLGRRWELVRRYTELAKDNCSQPPQKKRLKEIPRPSQQEHRAAPVFRGRHEPGSGLTGGFSATPGPDPGCFCDPVLLCPRFQYVHGVQKTGYRTPSSYPEPKPSDGPQPTAHSLRSSV